MLRMMTLLMLLLLLCFPAAAEEPALTVSVDAPIVGFTDQVIRVDVPFGGVVTFTLADELNVYRVWQSGQLLPGPNEIHWDGLGACEEPLTKGSYTLHARVEGNGQTAEASTQVTVASCHQAILYALPEREVLYAGETWAVEVHLVRKGGLIVEVRSAADPEEIVHVMGETLSGDVERFLWNGRIRSRRVPDGEYVVRFYAKDLPERYIDVPLTVSSETRPVKEVTLTGLAMPDPNATDAQIWAAMQQPSVVLDVARSSHQKVYEQPSSKSRVLGTFHGTSQAVAVLELQGKWAKVGAWNHEDASYVEGYVPQEKLMVVEPNPHWGVLIDKQAQTMAVFHDGVRIATMPVSTGLPEKGDLWQETSAGVFLTVDHMDTFPDDGYRYAYPIRFDGGNLLHELGYRMNGGKRDFSRHEPLLGQKASHGCIRMPALTGVEGVNAYWLWTHLPRYTRVILLDDPVQREADNLFAQVGRRYDPTGLAALATPTDILPEATEIVLTLGGDVVLGTRERWWKDTESLPNVVAEKGLDYFFRNLKDIFAADDMTLLNLECVLKDSRAGERMDKAYRFRGLPEYAAALPMASVEQVNLANNHYIDYGEAGKEATRAALDAAGVAYSGHGYTYVAEIAAHRIGFAGVRETDWLKNSDLPRQDIESLRAQGCEVIIYSCHWGQEYNGAHNAVQQEMARAIVDAGADVIVGTHPHVVQGIEHRDGAVVLYSLGNLMFGGTHDMTTFDGMLARLTLRFGDDGYEGCKVELIPVLTSSSAPENDFCPTPATGDDARRILMKVQADTAFLLQDVMYFPCE